MGFMAYSALGRGFLAGLFHNTDELPNDDNRRNSPRFQESEQNAAVQRTIDEIARDKAATPAQIALAWVLTQGSDVIPIPGCKSRTHLEDDLGALELELSADELARLNALVPPV